MVGSLQRQVLQGGQGEVTLSGALLSAWCQADVTPIETPRAGLDRKPGSQGASEQIPLPGSVRKWPQPLVTR